MNTGKLNRRITIVTAGAMSADGIGGFTEGTQTTRTTWCSASQISMAAALSYGLETSTATFIFKFKYYAADDITRVKEIQYEGRTFIVAQIKEVDEAKTEVQIIASERQ